MAKGIVIIGIPNCCAECSLINIDGDLNLSCDATSLYIDVKKLNLKPDWCPIKPIPDRKSLKDKLQKYDTDIHYEIGWNECLDEILKGV